jgi:hypothetical protein
MHPPVVLFFARGYQADFFPSLRSDRYRAVFVTLTRAERARVRARGAEVAACFEDDFERLPPAAVPAGYLQTAFPADRFLGRFDASRRREILGKEIAFWRGLIETHRPAAVVNELVAIEISEVLLIECRRAGVRYLAGMNCVVDDWFYWLSDPASLSGRHLKLPEPDADARTLAEGYLREVQARDYQPFYVKNLSARRDPRPLAVALAKYALWMARIAADRLSGRFRYERYDDEYGKKIAVYAKSLLLRYDTLEALPENAEVVFYPLHQEPEATLNYMSAFYANQVATIENILKCLTPEQVLVVKEHPVDKGALLRGKFRRLKREQSALYYLPAEVHGRQVLARATRVVTLTSTVGWEAALTGRTVYVLGQIFYDHVPGLQRIANLDELAHALRRPAAPGGIAPADALDFVARMTAASYPGNPFPHRDLYSERNRTRVIDAICAGAGL